MVRIHGQVLLIPFVSSFAVSNSLTVPSSMENQQSQTPGGAAAAASSSSSKVQRNITITFKVTINRNLDQNIDYEDPDVDDQTAFVRKVLEHSDSELRKKKGPKRCDFRKV